MKRLLLLIAVLLLAAGARVPPGHESSFFEQRLRDAKPTFWFSARSSSDYSLDSSNAVAAWFDRAKYVGPENLLSYSEALDTTSGGWARTGLAGIDANVIAAPSTTGTAEKLREDSSTNTHHIYQNATITYVAGRTYTATAVCKAAENSYVYQRFYDDSTFPIASYNLTTGALGTVSGASLSGVTIVAIPGWSGWYTIAATFTATHSTSTGYYYLGTEAADNTPSYTGTTGNGVYCTQVQLRDTARSLPGYQYTTASAVLGGVGNNFDPRENRLPYSSALDNAAWTKYYTNTAVTGQADPWGGTTAFKLTEDSTTNEHFYYPTINLTAGEVVTSCAIVKAGERTKFAIQHGGSHEAKFNLSTGALISSNMTSTNITTVATGWYRVCATGTAQTTTRFKLLDASGNDSYAGDGSSGLYVVQPQVFGTYTAKSDYIETTSAISSKALMQATATFRPTLSGGTTNKTGHTCIRFDGTDDLLSSSVTLPFTVKPDAKEIFYVMVPQSISSTQILFADASQVYRIRFPAISAFANENYASAWQSVKDTGPITTVGTVSVVDAWHDGTNVNIQVNNGPQSSYASSSTTGWATTGAISLGISGNYINGDVCEVIGFNRVLTAGERSYFQRQLQQYWSAKRSTYKPSIEARSTAFYKDGSQRFLTGIYYVDSAATGGNAAEVARAAAVTQAAQIGMDTFVTWMAAGSHDLTATTARNAGISIIPENKTSFPTGMSNAIKYYNGNFAFVELHDDLDKQTTPPTYDHPPATVLSEIETWKGYGHGALQFYASGGYPARIGDFFTTGLNLAMQAYTINDSEVYSDSYNSYWSAMNSYTRPWIANVQAYQSAGSSRAPYGWEVRQMADEAVATNGADGIIFYAYYDEGLAVPGQMLANGDLWDAVKYWVAAKNYNIPAPVRVYSFDDNAASTSVLDSIGYENLLAYPEDLTNAVWSKYNPATATDAQTFTEDTTNGAHYLTQSVSVTSGVKYTFSAQLRTLGGRNVKLQFSPVGGAVFNPMTASLIADDGSFSGGCVDKGSGWAKCSVIWTSNTTSAITAQIYSVNGTATSFAGDATKGFYAKEIQFRRTDNSPSNYISTNAVVSGGSSSAATASANTSTLTTTGKLNRALLFARASSDTVTLGSNAQSLLGSGASQSRSICMWVKPTECSNVNPGQALMYNNNGYLSIYQAYNNCRLDFFNGAHYYSDATAFTTAGNWAHVCMTYNGSQLRYYTNGTLKQCSLNSNGSSASDYCSVSNWTPSTLALSIGATGVYPNSAVDEYSIWQTALTADQIAWLYNNGAGR